MVKADKNKIKILRFRNSNFWTAEIYQGKSDIFFFLKQFTLNIYAVNCMSNIYIYKYRIRSIDL